MMLFMKVCGFGKCCGVSFGDSMMIPGCHNLRRYANKVFKRFTCVDSIDC